MAQEEGSAHLIESLEEALSRAFERIVRYQERVVIFIDGPNLYTTLRTLGQKVDYFKLAEELAQRPQRGVEVRAIDEDHHALLVAHDPLESPR